MNKYITKWQAILVWLQMIAPRWRALNGFCPSCNSDAPGIDVCPVCESYGYGAPFPPPKLKLRKWLDVEKSSIEIKYQIKNAVNVNRKKRAQQTQGE